MEEEPIMCKRNLRLLISLCTIVTFIFAQDSTNVTLTLQSNGNLDYESDSDIYGFQFSQNGCVETASGGDADAAGFTVSVGNNVLGFSFSGSFVPAGSGTLVELTGDLTYDCLSNFVISGAAGVGLTVEYLEGEATADYLSTLLASHDVIISRLARGVPVGGELEYMDSNTLNQAFTERRTLRNE